MPTAKTFLLAAAVASAAAVAAPPAADAMRPAIAPCNERSIGGKRIDGALWHAFRLRPRANTTCRFGMTLGTNAAILDVRVLKRPTAGRLVRVRRNEIVYRAGSGGREDRFAIAFKLKNLSGTGWVNVAFQAMPR